ncbi:MAG: hypothetical protein R2712_17345 [Vicinamibacterales bacterium]
MPPLTLLNPSPVRGNALLLIASLALFFLADVATGGGVASTLSLVAVLVLHELGHYVGMRPPAIRMSACLPARRRGRRSAHHDDPFKDAWSRCSDRCPGSWWDWQSPAPRSAAASLLPWPTSRAPGDAERPNLLPLGPLDGGRLFQLVLSRHRLLDLAFGLTAVVAFVGLALVLRSFVMAVIAFWVLATICPGFARLAPPPS